MSSSIRHRAEQAATAAMHLAETPAETRRAALEAIAETLEQHRSEIRDANGEDLGRAEREGLAAPLLKRLKFDDAKMDAVLDGMRSLIALPDPLGRTLAATELDRGLELYKVSCPIGVIGVIFESRPDALVQIASLCLKSGNASLLKGGREAAHTNRALARAMVEGAAAAGIPAGWMCLLETRADVAEMLTLDDCIDLLVPRGSNSFVRHILDHSRIPVMGHAEGICHVYLDREADPAMAEAIAVDAKCQYSAVCNAMETLLVDAAAGAGLLARVGAALQKAGAQLLGDPRCREVLNCEPASESDWDTEYLDERVSIRVVDGVDEAIEHIRRHGSGHTETIVTENPATAGRFLTRVDAGNVFWNASTRFSDGYRYGLGAEVGISTGKLHARGPVGLEGLTTYKWLLKGTGQTVAPYATGERRFTHRPLSAPFPRP